ncbi:MAG: AraC family transcriptional regulator [Oleiphilus sp.]|nr:MAG: AraC family transcriptional regulator [Oleiphilus sp.]
MEKQHSVPIALVRSLLVAAEQGGLNLTVLLEEAGLTYLEAILLDPESESRISLEDFGVLLRSLWLELGDEASGFLSHPLKIGTFGMMCHAIISSGNLRRALLRSARFIALMTDDLSIELIESGTEAKLLIHYDNPHGLDESFLVTSIFVIWIRMSCWLIDQPMLLERIQFRFPKPGYADEFSMMFPCRHNFSQNENSVVFSRHLLALPVQQDSETLTPFLSHAPESLLTQFRQDESMTGQVKRLLLHRDGMQLSLENLSFEEVADELHMTTHTVRRRLKDEGSSFQEIKDSLRRDRAQHLLDKPELSIQEITEQLGFSETAAFTRAFKKWTGLTPGAYRERQA